MFELRGELNRLLPNLGILAYEDPDLILGRKEIKEKIEYVQVFKFTESIKLPLVRYGPVYVRTPYQYYSHHFKKMQS